MARYRPLSDGLFEVETSAGPITVPSTEEELQANGYAPDIPAPPVPPPVGPRLAYNGAGGAPGSTPPTVTDTPPAMGPGSGAGGAPAQRLDQDLFRGAPNAPELVPPDERVTSVTKETREIKPDGSVVPTEREKPKTKTLSLSTGARTGSSKPTSVEVGRVIKQGKKLSPDTQEALSDASINKKLALQEQGDREAERAGRIGQVADDALAQQEREISQEQLRVDRLKQDFEARQARITKEREQVNKLEIDPDQVFNDGGGTFAKILAGISILAGGALQGLQGRASNPGLDAINQAIDRNIELQKEKIDRRRQGLADQETELERLAALYGSPEIAERELRNRQLSLIKSYADRATLDSPEDVRANVQQKLAELDAARAKEQAEIDQLAADDVQIQMKTWGGGGGGSGGAAGKASGSKKAMALISSARAGLQRLRASHAQYGKPGIFVRGGLGSSDASKDLTAQVNAITAPLDMALQGGGAPNKDTMEMINKTLLSNSGDQTEASIDAYLQQLDQLEQAYTGASGTADPASVEADE